LDLEICHPSPQIEGDMKTLFFAGIVLALAGCSTEWIRQSFYDVEQCESEASTATGLYKAGTNQERTWLDIKNDCLKKRSSQVR
jgi:hypothetical protein